MKRLLITLIAICSLVTAGAQRQRYNFNSDWNITFVDPDTNPSSVKASTSCWYLKAHAKQRKCGSTDIAWAFTRTASWHSAST